MTEMNETTSDEILFSDSLSTGASEWLSRTFEVREEWKQRGQEIFFAVNGESNVARNRLAAIIRNYFLRTELAPETVHRWASDSRTPVPVQVAPPKITASNSAYIDWHAVADYILMPCSVMFEEIAAENQKREAEFRLVYDSYLLRVIIYHARMIIQNTPEITEDELLKKIQENNKDAAMAHVKEAKKLERGKSPLFLPKEPQRPSLLSRYTSLH